jgi:hypothetical protein
MLDAKTSRILTAVLAVAGVLCAVGGVVFYARAWRLAPDVAQGAETADAACGRLLAPLGALERTENGLRLTVADVVEPRTRLADASSIIAACSDHVLTRFCLGKGCGDGAKVTMIMEMRRIN